MTEYKEVKIDQDTLEHNLIELNGKLIWVCNNCKQKGTNTIKVRYAHPYEPCEQCGCYYTESTISSDLKEAIKILLYSFGDEFNNLKLKENKLKEELENTILLNMAYSSKLKSIIEFHIDLCTDREHCPECPYKEKCHKRK